MSDMAWIVVALVFNGGYWLGLIVSQLFVGKDV